MYSHRAQVISFYYLRIAEALYYRKLDFNFSRSVYVNINAKIEEFSLRINKKTKKWHWYMARGLAQAANGDTSLAFDDIKTAINLAPRRLGPYLALANLNTYECSEEEVVRFFSQGIRYTRNHPDLYLYRGQVFYRLGRYEDAIQDFQLAIKKRTQKPYVFSHLALALLRNDQVELCDKWFGKARKSGRRSEYNYEVLYDLAVKSLLEGDFEEGLSWLKAACRENSFATMALIDIDAQYDDTFNVVRNMAEFKKILSEFIA